jgi:hypothetical protein
VRYAILLALLPLTLAACQTAAPESQAAACDPAGWDWLIGQPVEIVSSHTFPAPMRVVGPLGPLSEEYLPNRLNVIHDERGYITSVDCG